MLIITFIFVLLIAIYLIVHIHIHPLIVLPITGFYLGLATDQTPLQIIESIQAGMSSTMGYIALIVGLGSLLSGILQASGAQRKIAIFMRDKSEKKQHAFLAFLAILVGIPLFFEVGIILLLPTIQIMKSRSQKSLLYYTTPLLIALSASHVFIPPTPGPLFATQMLGIDLFTCLLFGLFLSILILLIVSPIFFRLFESTPIKHISTNTASTTPFEIHPAYMLFILIIPVFLILLSYYADNPIIDFLGHPVVAFIISLIIGHLILIGKTNISTQELNSIQQKTLQSVAVVIIVTGYSGAIREVLLNSSILHVKNLDILVGLPLVMILLVGFGFAAFVRVVQGSSTLATITVTTILAPLLATLGLSHMQMILIFCSIASGSVVLSHINDSGFWLIHQLVTQDLKLNLRYWTMLETAIGVTGLCICLVLSFLI